MNKIKSIIIDDEVKSGQYLRLLIEELGNDIVVEKIINDPHAAIEYINMHSLDLIFLDIAMPEISGLDLLQKVDHNEFEIIFVTGYDEYAINAFKACAIGYILKPVDEEDLRSAMQHAKDRILNNHLANHNQVLIDNLNEKNRYQQKIGIQTVDGLEFIKLSEIIRCEAMQKVTKVIAQNHRPLISSYHIGHFNRILKDYNFFACHKSHLINTSYIKSVSKDGSFVLLDNGHEVPISRRRKSEFKKQINHK